MRNSIEYEVREIEKRIRGAREVVIRELSERLRDPGLSEVERAKLEKLGGFQSIGVDVGSASFVDTNNLQAGDRVTAIYPGVYVRRSL